MNVLDAVAVALMALLVAQGMWRPCGAMEDAVRYGLASWPVTMGATSIDATSPVRRLGSIGALAGIAGAAIALLSNARYPRPARWDRPEPLLELIAGSDRTTWLAIFSVGIVVGSGVTFALFGLAVALDEGGPRWLGWIGFVAAVAALAVGLVQWSQGSSVLLTNQLFPLVAFVVLAWMLVASVVLWMSYPG